MANPTTNYSFVLPTSTDLVTDLPADFDVALQGVDTRLKALQPGTTSGDLAYSSATANTNVRLPIGSNGQVLAVVAGVPAWAATADQTPLTTKGDLFTFSTVDARLGVGANGTVLQADSAEATGLKWVSASAAAVTKIATVVASGTPVTISFTSISSSFQNLRIVWSGRSADAGQQNLFARFNSDTGANYDYQRLTGTGGTASALESMADTKGEVGTFSGTHGGGGEIIIPNYKDTTFDKTIVATSFTKRGTASGDINVRVNGLCYRSATAISRIDLTTGATGFTNGSTFTLYGES